MQMQILGNFGEFWGIHILGNVMVKIDKRMDGECIEHIAGMLDDPYSCVCVLLFDCLPG